MVEALLPTGSRIGHEHIIFIVIDYPQNMGMAANEQLGAELFYKTLGPGTVSAGIATDVYHQNAHSFPGKPLILRAIIAQLEIVGIAVDAAQGGSCGLGTYDGCRRALCAYGGDADVGCEI